MIKGIPTNEKDLTEKQFNTSVKIARFFLVIKYFSFFFFDVILLPIVSLVVVKSFIGDSVGLWIMLFLYVPYFVYKTVKLVKEYNLEVYKLDKATSNRETFSSLSDTKL